MRMITYVCMYVPYHTTLQVLRFPLFLFLPLEKKIHISILTEHASLMPPDR